MIIKISVEPTFDGESMQSSVSAGATMLEHFEWFRSNIQTSNKHQIINNLRYNTCRDEPTQQPVITATEDLHRTSKLKPSPDTFMSRRVIECPNLTVAISLPRSSNIVCLSEKLHSFSFTWKYGVCVVASVTATSRGVSALRIHDVFFSSRVTGWAATKRSCTTTTSRLILFWIRDTAIWRLAKYRRRPMLLRTRT
jgi:hypothetical protein